MSIPGSAIRTARRVLAGLLIVLAAVTVATIGLAGVLPAVSGDRTLVVRGGSMEPAIPLGSALIVIPVSTASLRVGDIVTVQNGPDALVYTHRISRVVSRTDGTWIETWGDANAVPDPSLIPATAVIGRAGAWIPVAGTLLGDLTTPLGMALIVVSAMALLACDWFLESLVEGHPGAARRPSRGAAAPDLGAGSRVPA